jgi:hypothetical protein
MTLYEEIQAACTQAQIDERDCHAIAALVSAGRTRPNKTEIGNGTILEVLGLALGNTMLDIINGDTNYRYVKPLLEQGRLQIGSALAQAAVQAFVPALLTQAQADALMAIGNDPAPVNWQQVQDAIINAGA